MNTEIKVGAVALFVICALLLSFGCSSASSNRAGPYVKPGLVLVPADQAKYYGLASDSETKNRGTPNYAPTDVRSVQSDSEVTAIQFNRYPDPAHPNELMHEAHIVYRRDSAPRWRLTAPAADQQILIGPQLTDGRGEIKGLAAPEVDAYLREQRTTLRRQDETLSKLTETMRQMAEQQKQFAEQLARTGGSRREAQDAAENQPTPAPITVPRVLPAASPLPQTPKPLSEKEPNEIPER